MMPETWLPTWTVVTADSVPVAVTVATTSPCSTLPVRNFGSDDRLRSMYVAPASTTATSAATITQPFFPWDPHQEAGTPARSPAALRDDHCKGSATARSGSAASRALCSDETTPRAISFPC